MGKAKIVKSLLYQNCTVGNAEGGRVAGIRLAAAFGASHRGRTIEDIYIAATDMVVSGILSEWASALKKMTALKKLHLFQMRKRASPKMQLMYPMKTCSS